MILRTAMKLFAPFFVCFAMFATGATSRANDPDCVLVLENGQKKTIQGTIESITGQYGLTLSSGGHTLRIPMSKILAVQTRKNVAYQKADDLFESACQTRNIAELQQALSGYEEVRRDTELALWLRQWLTVRIVDCQRVLGQDTRAAQQFFLLCHIDPYTPFINHIPLEWTIRSSFEERNVRAQLSDLATQWLSPADNPTKRPNPVGQLLAASLLLDSPGPNREAARKTLESLVTCTSPDDKSPGLNETCRIVSLLAMTQLWRLKLLTGVDTKELDSWLQTIEKLPGPLQAGPLYLAGEGFWRSGNPKQARDCFLKIKILHGDHTNLLLRIESKNY